MRKMIPTIDCTAERCGSAAWTISAIGSQHHPRAMSATGPCTHSRRVSVRCRVSTSTSGNCSASVVQAWCAETVEFADDDAVAVLVGDEVLRILAEVEGAEAHVGGVDRQDAPDQRFAEAEQHLDGLESLDRADNAGQHAEHTGLRAAGRQLGGRRLGD